MSNGSSATCRLEPEHFAVSQVMSHWHAAANCSLGGQLCQNGEIAAHAISNLQRATDRIGLHSVRRCKQMNVQSA